MESLLRRGADIEAGDDYERTPLHLACDYGHREVALLLLERGADIEAGDSIGRTPLHWACRDDHIETALLLVRRGAEIDVADSSGKTPLQLAEQKGFGPALVAERRKYLAWMRRKAFLAVLSESGCLRANHNQQLQPLPLGEDTLVAKVLRVAHRDIASYI